MGNVILIERIIFHSVFSSVLLLIIENIFFLKSIYTFKEFVQIFIKKIIEIYRFHVLSLSKLKITKIFYIYLSTKNVPKINEI